jgi:hypothetical protein
MHTDLNRNFMFIERWLDYDMTSEDLQVWMDKYLAAIRDVMEHEQFIF